MAEREAIAWRLHELRSTLARLKVEIDVVELDRGELGVGVRMALSDAFRTLEQVEALVLELDQPVVDSPRVFVVDDDARLAELTARQLARHGFATAVRDDVGVALAEMDAQRDVLVLDLGLTADLDHEIRSRLRQLRPVAVTGGFGRNADALAREVDAMALLTKPIEPAELAQAVRNRLAATAQ